MRNWERRRGPIEYALSQGKTPAQIAARYQTTFAAMNKLLAQWGLLECAKPPRHVPVADDATAFLDLTAIPIKQAAAMAEKDPERNERIRQLRRDGLNPATISRRLNLSRNVVIGVLHRAGMGLQPHEKARAMSKGGNRGSKVAKRARQQSPDAYQFGMGCAKNATRLPGPRKGESTGPLNIDKHYEPIPSHAVTIEHVTGCRWPHGDVRNEGIAYCNKQRCCVRVHGQAQPIRTAYCDDHWDMRRASRTTKIVAETAP